MKFAKHFLSGAAILAASAIAAPAFAAPIAGTAKLCIDDGPGGQAQYCVVDGGVGDADGITDGAVVMVKPSYGIWSVNVDTGVSNPTAGLDYPEIDISFSHTSTGAGSLTVEFSQIGFDLADARDMGVTVGGTLDGGASFTGSVVYGSTNGLFENSGTVASVGPVSGNPFGASAFGTLPADDLFSLTMRFTLTHTSGGISTGNFNSHPLPEPTSLALLGLGVFGLGLVRRRKAG